MMRILFHVICTIFIVYSFDVRSQRIKINRIDSVRIKHIDFTTSSFTSNCCGSNSETLKAIFNNNSISKDTLILDPFYLEKFRRVLLESKRIKAEPCKIDGRTLTYIYSNGKVMLICTSDGDLINIRGKYYENKNVFNTLILLMGPDLYSNCEYCPNRLKFNHVKILLSDWNLK